MQHEEDPLSVLYFCMKNIHSTRQFDSQVCQSHLFWQNYLYADFEEYRD